MSNHILIITIEPSFPPDAVDGGIYFSIKCPGVTDECREWQECGTTGCTVPQEYNHGARGALGHGVEHRWFREPGIWGIRTDHCFAERYGEDSAELLAEHHGLTAGQYEVTVSWDGGSMGLALVGDVRKADTRA